MPVPPGTPKFVPPPGTLPPLPPYNIVKPRAPETPSSAVISGVAKTTPAAIPSTTPAVASSSTSAPAGSGPGPSYGMAGKQKEASEKDTKGALRIMGQSRDRRSNIARCEQGSQLLKPRITIRANAPAANGSASYSPASPPSPSPSSHSHPCSEPYCSCCASRSRGKQIFIPICRT